MKKDILLKKFENNLKAILSKKDATALISVPACVLAFEMAMSEIIGDSIELNHMTVLKAVFFDQMDLLASKKIIRGKAAYYSKTTFDRLSMNLGNQLIDDKAIFNLLASPELKAMMEEGRSKNDNINIFQETKQIAEKCEKGLNRKLTSTMISNTVAYRSRKNGHLLALATSEDIPRPSDTPFIKVETSYVILKEDSFAVAQKLVGQKLRPLVLNMANKISIGGGVEHGSNAQEESLFRASNYFQALYPHGKIVTSGNHNGRIHYNFPIAEFGSYYTPDVQVFRDSAKQYSFIKPFSVACIAIAGYNLGKLEKLEKHLQGKPTLAALLTAFKAYTKIKIEHLLEVAILRGHDSLVLGAISCGAFRLKGDEIGITASCVAEAYSEVLQKPCYQNRFKNITFAILDAGPTGKINFDIFKKMTEALSRGSKALDEIRNASQTPSPIPLDSQEFDFSSKLLQFSPVKTPVRRLKEADIKNDAEATDAATTRVNKLYTIFEKDLFFFDNLPPKTDKENVKKAVKIALRDHVELDELFMQHFEDTVGVNGAQVLKQYLNALTLAFEISDDVKKYSTPS